MKTSFKQAIQDTPETQTALPTAEPKTTALSTNSGDVQGLTGEWGTGDIQIPRLSLVQKSGTLADDFPKGTFVYNKELVVGSGNDPLKITVLSARKYYQEDIPFGESDDLPQIFEHLEDARAAGFTTEWNSAQPRVKDAADLIVLVPVPEQYATAVFKGQGYTRAMWTLVSSAYNSAAKTIVTAAVCGHLRGGLYQGGWELTSNLRTNQRNSWYVPIVRSCGAHEKEFKTFLEKQVL